MGAARSRPAGPAAGRQGALWRHERQPLGWTWKDGGQLGEARAQRRGLWRGQSAPREVSAAVETGFGGQGPGEDKGCDGARP